ncbi:hypothetical protein OAM43_02865 [Candidatus Pelagibacter sp.]|nr:hypothetical protein [Candidatus Pelagibacter sp.]
MKFQKIYFLAIIFIFLSGCIQSTALLGPSVTLATTGNVFQAGLQYGANTAIKKETGKDALSHVKDVVENNSKKKKFEKKFINLVEKRFNITKQKLSLN